MARLSVRKPYERSGPRASDGIWRHDRAPGIPASVKATTTSGSTAFSNTKLVVSNLHYNVTAKDLISIFGQIGTLVREPHIKYDRSGRSTGIAYITFEKPVEATRAKKQFDGIFAKDQPMSIAYDTAAPRRASAPASLLNRIQKPALINRLASEKGATADTRAKNESSAGPIRNRNRGGRVPGRAKKGPKTAEELDKELDAFMDDDATKVSFTADGEAAAAGGDVEMAV